MFDKSFEIKVDTSKCTSLVEGGAFFDGKKEYDSWRFRDIKLESGKIYGLVGEYGQGPMYLSYLIGGKVDFGDLRLLCNGQELSRKILEQISWNLEPSNEELILSILVYTFFSRMFDLMLPPVVKHSTAVV